MCSSTEWIVKPWLRSTSEPRNRRNGRGSPVQECVIALPGREPERLRRDEPARVHDRRARGPLRDRVVDLQLDDGVVGPRRGRLEVVVDLDDEPRAGLDAAGRSPPAGRRPRTQAPSRRESEPRCRSTRSRSGRRSSRSPRRDRPRPTRRPWPRPVAGRRRRSCGAPRAARRERRRSRSRSAAGRATARRSTGSRPAPCSGAGCTSGAGAGRRRASGHRSRVAAAGPATPDRPWVRLPPPSG